MITLEDYNAISGAGAELADDEILLYPYKTEFHEDSLTIDGCGTWNVRLMDRQPFNMGMAQANIMGSWFIVAPDMAVIRQINDYRNALNASLDPTESLATSYILESYGFDLSCDDEKQAEIYRTIVKRMSELTGQEDPAVDYPGYTLDSKAEGRADIIALNGGLFFLGVMLGAVFLFGTVLTMYYKQISEGYEDQDRFDILMKVGMSRKEVKQSINSQVLTVFFLPLVTAMIHTVVAFPFMTKIMRLLNFSNVHAFMIATGITIAVFAVVYVIVYAVTARTYYNIVEE